MENPSSSNARLQIKPLLRLNWEDATRLQLHDYQEDFLPSVLHSLAQSKFENLFSYGIFEGEEMVGFLMYGEFDGICWINRLMIDKAHQERGLGRLAVLQLLDMLRKHPRCQEIRTSFSRKNALAEYFFKSVGFTPIGEGMDTEIVMRWNKR